jgi:hypothetical protein
VILDISGARASGLHLPFDVVPENRAYLGLEANEIFQGHDLLRPEDYENRNNNTL